MNQPKTPSRFIAFLDECGDHSLEKIDNDFPLFVLSAVVVERSLYVEKIIPALTKLKLKFWNHEGINLHSREIRMAENDFSFLQNPHSRTAFIEEINSIMTDLEFTLFISAIDKIKHKNRHGAEATNPYDLALINVFRDIKNFLENNGEENLPVIAESRGRNEDNQLIASFYQLMSTHNELVGLFNAPQHSLTNFPIIFRRKHDNIAGIQIADLCAYPVARKILNPNKLNYAFDKVHPHIYSHDFITA